MYFQRLRDLREDHDLSQEELGHVLQIRQTVYSRYERGVQDIPLRHLLVLADYYRTSTDYLLGRTNNPAPPMPRRRDTVGGQLFGQLER